MDIRLRELRIKKNIGLNELAKKARIAPSYLSALERGLKTNPSSKTMNKIAEALGATVPEIFYNKDKEAWNKKGGRSQCPEGCF